MGFIDCLQERFTCKGLFFENSAESLFCERVGVQDLVSTAGGGRKRNQNIGFSESQNLTYGIGSRSGQDQIGGSEQMPERFIHIFILNIAFHTNQTFVQITFATDMYNLEIR